jgi:3-polyprenyl-4-hydroxybenzoate decarboxylase
MNLEDLIAPTTPAKITSVGNIRTIEDLDGMDADDLLALREEIDARLPATKLSDINLAEELVLQFQKVKSMQQKALDSSAVSAQQKAAVANACSSSLAQLVKMQTELHNAERLKMIEQALIQVMRDQPEAIQLAFFDKYERILGA